MLERFKIITTRGESYVFETGPKQPAIDVHRGPDGETINVFRQGKLVAYFPTRNVEAVTRIPVIEGDLA